MSIHDQGSRGALITRADQTGKVFIVVGQDVRRCLVCEEMFTRQGAAEHASMVCTPERAPMPSK